MCPHIVRGEIIHHGLARAFVLGVEDHVGVRQRAEFHEKDGVVRGDNAGAAEVGEHARLQFLGAIQPPGDAAGNFDVIAAAAFRRRPAMDGGIRADAVEKKLGLGKINPMVMAGVPAGAAHSEIEIIDRGRAQLAERVPSSALVTSMSELYFAFHR